MSSTPAQPGTVRIRRATDAHAAPIAALLNDEILHGVAHFGAAPEPPEAVEAQRRQWADRYPWLVAEDAEARFLGFARAAQWKPREAYAWMAEAAIYMTPQARGLGVGRALYARLFDTLRAQGFVTVVGGVTIGNAVSERLHEAFGMPVAGEIRSAGYKHGRWWGVRYYQMILQDLVPDGRPDPVRPVSDVWAVGRVDEVTPTPRPR